MGFKKLQTILSCLAEEGETLRTFKFKNPFKFHSHSSTKSSAHKADYSMEYSAFHERPRMEYMIDYAFIDEEHENIVWCGDQSLFKVWEFRGPDMASATPLELMSYTALLNNALKMMDDGYIIYLDAQRHIASSYDKSKMPTPLLQQFEDERAEYYGSSNHFETNYYLVMYKIPPLVLRDKLIDFFIQDSKKSKEEGSTEDLYSKTIQDFLKQSHVFVEMLGTHCFKELKELNATETISYLHNIVSDHRMVIKPNPHRYINDYICDSPLVAGRSPILGSKHMRAITILNFPPMSSPATFNILNMFDFEYRWVSRWICLSKAQNDEEMKNTQKLWGQMTIPLTTMIKNAITNTAGGNHEIDENAIDNANDASQARAELNADIQTFGFYTMVMLVFDETKKGVEDKAKRVVETLNSLGYPASIETENAVEAYRGTLPGCYRCNVRRPRISSLNFCHLAPTTATWSGDKRNNALKGPVLLYTDSSGYTPFRFSFHCGDVGHTMIVGPSGAGKSVLLNTMEAHFTKYPNSNVFIFDKGASSRCLTLGVGGNFYNLAAEGSKELSFQPLANIDDPDEMKWAKEWILAYLESKGVRITPEIDNAVWNGLISTRNSRKNLRTISQFCILTQNIEVREALRPLTMDGSYGKLFDNDHDYSGSGRWQVFEMEALMNTPAIVPPTLDYLFHRIETQIKKATGPSIIVLDECWLFFDNPAFRKKLREYFKDMRKKNTSIIFATQNLSDIASKKDLFTVVVDNCPSRIFLPNIHAVSEANSGLYRQFGCNETQINIISQMTPKQDYYYFSERGNRIFQLALQPIEIPFVTSTSKSDQLAINKILEKGDPKEFVHDWLIYKGAVTEWNKLVQSMQK